MTLIEFVNRAGRVPFVDHGRDYAGWDCWGLVLCAYRDVYGIALPSFTESYPDAGETRASRATISDVMAAYAGEACRGAWQRVAHPAPGDVLLLKVSGRPIHVGLYIDRGEFIHAERKIGTNVESIRSLLWRDRVEATFHYVG